MMDNEKQCFPATESRNRAMATYLGTQLNEDRLNHKLFCDFTLIVNGVEFNAHKCVLGVEPALFKVMFNSNNEAQHRAILNGVDSKMMALVLDYLYIGSIKVTRVNVYDLTETAHYLQMSSIKMHCAAFLRKNVTKDSCIKDWIVAKRCSIDCGKLERFIDKYIPDIKLKEEDVSEISFEAFLSLTKKTTFKHLFEGFLVWLKKHNPTNQDQVWKQIFKCIDVDNFSTKCLEKLVSSNVLLECNLEVTNLLRFRKHASKTDEAAFVISWNQLDKTYLKAFNAVDKQFSKRLKLNPSLTIFATVISNQNVYVLGESPGVKSNGIWSYNKSRVHASDCIMQCNIFKQECLFNHSRSNFGCTVFNNRIYVAGGLVHGYSQVSKVSSRVDSYDFVTKQWFYQPCMKVKRQGLSLVAHDNCLYAIGGITDDSCSCKVVECYDGKVWKRKESMNESRTSFAAVSLNGLIYVIGGISGWENEKFTSWYFNCSVERYDPTTNKWSFVASMNKVKDNHGACVWQGKIYVADNKTSEVYDPSTNEWAILEDGKRWK